LQVHARWLRELQPRALRMLACPASELSHASSSASGKRSLADLPPGRSTMHPKRPHQQCKFLHCQARQCWRKTCLSCLFLVLTRHMALGRIGSHMGTHSTISAQQPPGCHCRAWRNRRKQLPRQTAACPLSRSHPRQCPGAPALRQRSPSGVLQGPSSPPPNLSHACICSTSVQACTWASDRTPCLLTAVQMLEAESNRPCVQQHSASNPHSCGQTCWTTHCCLSLLAYHNR
jgi:hypothetical protein